MAGLLLGTPAAVLGDAFWLESRWLKVNRIRPGTGPAKHRLVHFTDIHHKKDAAWLRRVVRAINAQSPEMVLFTGDLVEDRPPAAEALEILGGIKSPLYGVSGNHDYWAQMPFTAARATFEATGGAWLLDQVVRSRDGAFAIHGATGNAPYPHATVPGVPNVLLTHYPSFVKRMGARRFDLMLAGHSHGGQVRLPFIGALALPYRVDEYDLGFFRTEWGPLYVGSGIGWFHMNVRFLCRPEITVIEL